MDYLQVVTPSPCIRFGRHIVVPHTVIDRLLGQEHRAPGAERPRWAAPAPSGPEQLRQVSWRRPVAQGQAPALPHPPQLSPSRGSTLSSRGMGLPPQPAGTRGWGRGAAPGCWWPGRDFRFGAAPRPTGAGRIPTLRVNERAAALRRRLRVPPRWGRERRADARPGPKGACYQRATAGSIWV